MVVNGPEVTAGSMRNLASKIERYVARKAWKMILTNIEAPTTSPKYTGPQPKTAVMKSKEAKIAPSAPPTLTSLARYLPAENLGSMLSS